MAHKQFMFFLWHLIIITPHIIGTEIAGNVIDQ